VLKIRRLLTIGFQAIAIGLITFGLAEATVRVCRYLFPSALPSAIFYDKSYNRYRGKPGAPSFGFRLNSAGFKDIEFEATKRPGTLRVIALGDSFAFGAVPYQDNYLTVVEERLKSQGARMELFNMGIPGLAPQDYLSVLANEGLKLNPDLVLVSFFVGNDFDETMRLRTRLHQFSDFVALIKYVIDLRVNMDGRVYESDTTYDDNAPFFRESTYIEIEKQRSWIYRQPPTYPRALNDAVRYLVQMKDLAAQQGAGFMVFMMPDEFQVSATLRTRVLEALQLQEGDIDLRQPNRFLSNELSGHRIISVDSLDAFTDKGQTMTLYKPLDSHWNIAGNALAAEVLMAPLKRVLQGISDKGQSKP
jgi:SGNH hydrolase-like domain, acetyltransferase AlgX